MNKIANRWITVMIVTVLVTFCVYVWFMLKPETRYPLFFGVLFMAFLICGIAGYIAHLYYSIKEK